MAKQRLRLADMAGEDARSEERQGERGKQDKIDQGSGGGAYGSRRWRIVGVAAGRCQGVAMKAPDVPRRVEERVASLNEDEDRSTAVRSAIAMSGRSGCGGGG